MTFSIKYPSWFQTQVKKRKLEGNEAIRLYNVLRQKSGELVDLFRKYKILLTPTNVDLMLPDLAYVRRNRRPMPGEIGSVGW